MSTTNSNGALSFVDIAARMFGDNSRERTFVDIAAKRNDIWEDIPMRAASDGDTEIVRFRTALPTAQWLHIGKGLVSSKGSVASTRIVCGNVGSKLELFDKIKRKAVAAGRWDELYEEEASGHTESIALDVVKMLLYGDLRENPDGFNGLCKWYSRHTSNDNTNPAYNVIDAGGSEGDSNGSIYLCGWGTQGMYGFYPTSSKTAGIEITPLEKVLVHEKENPDATMWAWVQDYELNVGLAVADWRKGGRICNIDRDKHLKSMTHDEKMEEARKFFSRINRLTGRVKAGGVKRAFYMDERIWEQAKEFASTLTLENATKESDLNGHPVRTLNGIPVRVNEVQNVDEGVIPAMA